MWLNLVNHTRDLYVSTHAALLEIRCLHISSTTPHLWRALPAYVLSRRCNFMARSLRDVSRIWLPARVLTTQFAGWLSQPLLQSSKEDRFVVEF